MPKIGAKTLSDMMLKNVDKYHLVVGDEIKNSLRHGVFEVDPESPPMNIAVWTSALGGTSIIKLFLLINVTL
jgi:hypothetical protein